MDRLTQKNFNCSRGLQYHYYIADQSKPDTSQPTLIFLHGWPDSSALWQFIAPKFVDHGYRVIVPDLLGYGGTSKPTDANLYAWDRQAGDMIELLNHESIEKVITVGHDWGSMIAQRIYLFFPERVTAVALLCVAYFPPVGVSGPLDPVTINDNFEEIDGYRRFQYQTFFIQEDAPKIWDDHLESAWTALHVDGVSQGKRMFCEDGVMRDYLINNTQEGPLKPFALNPDIRDPWIKLMKEGGFTAPFMWYKAMWENPHGAAEKELPPERSIVNVPMLYLYGDEDTVLLSRDILGPKEAGLLPDLTMHGVRSGHWVPYENPDAVTAHLEDWLQSKKL